jgi:hypothetical protein
MPLPYFNRPSSWLGDSPSSSPSRFSAMQQNVRSILNGSSIYSNSPVPSNNSTPKLPLLGFLRRPHSPPGLGVSEVDLPRDSTSSRSPLHPQYTAGSYMREIAPEDEPAGPLTAHVRHGSLYGSVDPETEHLAELVNNRRTRTRRRRRKHRQRAWVRKRKDGSVCFSFIKSPAARSKCTACLMSGIFLTTVLTICKFSLGQLFTCTIR